MGVPLNHPCYFRILHYKPSILGYPHLWKPIYVYVDKLERHLCSPSLKRWLILGALFQYSRTLQVGELLSIYLEIIYIYSVSI